MHCPACQHPESKVLDSRASDAGIRRRRQCLSCGGRFTTYERTELKLPLVVKKDGSREPFERDKVLAGLRLACRKRPVSAAALEDAASRVEREILGGSEVAASEVGRAVLDELRTLDPVAYLRFASVYLEVDSAHDFMKLFQSLTREREPRAISEPGFESDSGFESDQGFEPDLEPGIDEATP